MELDVSQYSCPNPECADFGKVGAGNIRIHCRKDRRLRCVKCNGRFSARQGTVFYNLKTDEEKVLLALKMISERCSARGTARALGTNEDTVLGWVRLAARHASEVSNYLITRLNVTQLQLDELWSFVGKKDVARNVPDPSPVKGDAWVWRAVDAGSRLRVANHLSKTREIADAQPFIEKIAHRLGHLWVLFTSDKLKAYLGALREVFGIEEQPPRKHTGRPPKRRKVFPQGLLYGQVDKERVSGHLECVDRKAAVGTMADIQKVMDRDGHCKVINTSLVERDNLSLRQHNGRVVRKTLSYSKVWQMHQASIDFDDAVHNFVRVHSSLRIELPEPQGRRKYKQRTPAMAAGLTDHVWSIRELVTYRLPPRL